MLWLWFGNCTEAIKIIRRLQRAAWLRPQVAMVCAGDAKEYTLHTTMFSRRQEIRQTQVRTLSTLRVENETFYWCSTVSTLFSSYS